MEKLLKYLMLMLVATFSLTFTSCGSDDDEPVKSLAGTRWTVTYLGDKYVCEFISSTKVQSYEADINGNYENYLHEDTYTYDGSNVKFNGGELVITDVIGLFSCYYYYFKSAVVSDNTMIVTTDCVKLTITNISTGEYTTENKGSKTFTFMKMQN